MFRESCIQLLLVGSGGAVGSMLRFAVARWFDRPAAAFPVATLLVNIAGGFAIGAAVAWLSNDESPAVQRLRPLLVIGLLGGFTTFSAFSIETVTMIERRQFGFAATYVGLSVIGSLSATMLGLFLVRTGG
jgi:fluoride exporter